MTSNCFVHKIKTSVYITYPSWKLLVLQNLRLLAIPWIINLDQCALQWSFHPQTYFHIWIHIHFHHSTESINHTEVRNNSANWINSFTKYQSTISVCRYSLDDSEHASFKKLDIDIWLCVYMRETERKTYLQKITTLNHKILDHPMKLRAFKPLRNSCFPVNFRSRVDI